MPEPDYQIEVAVVFAEPRTREWAEHVCARIESLVGTEGVHSRWWHLPQLNDPTVLAEAVQAASTADVIVVAVPAVEELPEDLWVWLTLWLPRRRLPSGALVALLRVPPALHRGPALPRACLQTAARRAGLDFLPCEQELPDRERPHGASARGLQPWNLTFGPAACGHQPQFSPAP